MIAAVKSNSANRIVWNRKTNEAKLDYKTFPLGRWIHEVDNDHDMLRCPDCDGRVTAEFYLLAIGTYGIRYCPYCGKNMVYFT